MPGIASPAGLLLPQPGIIVPVPKPPSWLRGDWRFGEGSGTFLGDHSRYRNHGTIHDASWVAGKHTYALDFNGSSDYVDCGNGSSLNDLHSGDLTVEAWIKVNTIPTAAFIGKIPGWYCYIFYNKLKSWFYYDTTDSDALDSVAFPTGEWVHVVVTLENKLPRMFKNGQEIVYAQQVTGSGSATSDALKNFLIGAKDSASPTSYFDGFIDEVRIYGIALSASEVLARYNATA